VTASAVRPRATLLIARSARAEMLAYIIGFFYFYAELLRLELQMMILPEEYKLCKFTLH
jgi:hypothetical protein